MNIEELDKFELADAIDFHSDLNPQLYRNEKMAPKVHHALMRIASSFKESLGVSEIALVDITVSGSNAAYSYTTHSDIDLHLIVDFSQLSDDAIYRELFDAKKYSYNDRHNIKVKGYDVELYVQDSAQPHKSLGEYSLLNNTWNKFPTKQRANLDDRATKMKFDKLKNLAIRALAADDESYLTNVLSIVKRYRQAGLEENGEFGPENLAFKMLRTQGFFEKLWAKRDDYESHNLSLETAANPVDTDLERELNDEFNNYGRTKTAEDIIKELHNSNDNLFDDFDFDYIHTTAESISKISEASYEGNLGAMEMFQFYQTADESKIDLLTRLIAAHKNKEAWELVQHETNTQLVGKEFNEELSESEIQTHLSKIVNGKPEYDIIDCQIFEMNQYAKLSGYNCQLLESNQQDNKKINNFFNGITSIEPTVGTSCYILELMFFGPIMSFIGSSTKQEIIKINQKSYTGGDYIEYLTDAGNKYPNAFTNGAQIAKTFFFSTEEQYKQIITAATISFSNYKIFNKLAENKLIENPITDFRNRINSKAFRQTLEIYNNILADNSRNLTPEEALIKAARAVGHSDKQSIDHLRHLIKQNEINEGVGLIVQGVNTTADVKVGQTKIEAKKLGFKVNNNGIPPTLKTNGKLAEVFELKESMPLNDWLVLLENSAYTNNLLESVDTKAKETAHEFEQSFSSEPLVNSSYYIIPMFVFDKITVADTAGNNPPTELAEPRKLINKTANTLTFDINGREVEYPDKRLSNLMYATVILCKDANTYNKARTWLSLRDNIELPSTQKSNGLLEAILDPSPLYEFNMSPSKLQGAVDEMISKTGPQIGLEFEVCMPNGIDGARGDDYNIDISPSMTIDDLDDFFESNEMDDFRPIVDSYQEWIYDKEAEWTDEQVQDAINSPAEYTDIKMQVIEDFDVDSTNDSTDAMIKITGNEDSYDMDQEIAEDILIHAANAVREFGPVKHWYGSPSTLQALTPHAQMYYEIFIEDSDNAIDPFRDYFQQVFFENEVEYNDEQYSMGAYLLDQGYEKIKDFWYDNTDFLYWPGAGDGDQPFDIDVAHQIASDMTDELGFQVEVGDGYHSIEDRSGLQSNNTWIIEEDPTIEPDEGDNAFEIVMPVRPYASGVNDIEEFTDFLKTRHAYTNSTTGLHINVSLQNIPFDKLDYAKLVVMLGDDHVLKQFNREFNTYSLHAMKQLQDAMDKKQGFDTEKRHKADAYGEMMQQMKTKTNMAVQNAFKDIDFGKYSSVGIKDGYIEFRSMGGDNYLDNIDTIINTINRFIVAFGVASDETAYQKEYGKKLYKLAQGIDSKYDGGIRKNAMTLFAGFSANLISKEELVQNLKRIRGEKESAKTDAIRLKAHKKYELLVDYYVDEITKNTDIPESSVREYLVDAISYEMMQTPVGDLDPYEHKTNAATLAFNNIIKDPKHYVHIDDDDEPGDYDFGDQEENNMFKNGVKKLAEMHGITDIAKLRSLLYKGMLYEKSTENIPQRDALFSAYRNMKADIQHYMGAKEPKETMTSADAVRKVAAQYSSLTTSEAASEIQHGMEPEMAIQGDANKALQAVVKNILNDLGHYHR